MNQLKEIVDQNGEKETYTYDSQGRMSGHTNRNQVRTTYGYTIDNQLRFKKAEPSEADDASIEKRRNRKKTPSLTYTYSYNSLGQLTEASGGGVVYNYTYTSNGNMMDKLVNGSKTLSYNYTSSGRVAGITDKSGKKTTYQYDKAGKVVSAKDNGKLVAEYNYYKDGNLQKVCFANGIETEYTYDADKNYKNITTKTAEGETLLEYTYQYDGNGNRTSKISSKKVSRHNGNDSSIGTTSYLYDCLQRLQEVSYPTNRVEQYQYDKAGNRALKKYGTAENFKTGSYLEEYYTYDNRNRLLERSNPQNVTYYQYDNQGNTISELTKRYLKQGSIKTQEGNTTTITTSMAQTEVEQYKIYEYDSFNKTARVVVEDYPSQSTEGHSITTEKEAKTGKTVHIQQKFYDAENLRYGIEEDGEQTNFVTNGWSVFIELDAEWKPTKRLVRGYGIIASEEIEKRAEREPKPFAEIQNQKLAEKYHFYHQNEHGDTEYITGSNRKVTNAYTYDAFGTITNSSELVKNRYTYNGEQYDQISQQYYLRARNYNSLIGRFTQEDVYHGDGLNLYAYCGNNPVMYVDPSGYGSDKCGQQNSSQYPPRTKEAREEAQKVAEKMEGLISKKDHPSITVFIHENGTVSVGMSGKSGTDKIKTNSKKLQEVLGEKYNVSPDSMPTDNLIEVGCPLGNCSEPKAVNAAHSNASPITGYDTVWRGKGEMPEKYQYTGQNVGGEVEGKYKQMDPCDTCKDPENIKEYMDYANGNE